MNPFGLYCKPIVVGAATDPYWANVTLYMPLTTDFSDVLGKTATVNGAIIDSGSALFDGTNDNFTFASDAAFGFGSGDFTIEAYGLRTSGATGNRCMLDTRTAANQGVGVYGATGTFAGVSYANNGAVITGSATVMNLVSLQHWAVARQGTTIYGYQNGVQVFTTTDARSLAAASTLFVGDNYVAVSQPFGGRMQHLRITKGVCRYPSGTTFTPPATPFPTTA